MINIILKFTRNIYIILIEKKILTYIHAHVLTTDQISISLLINYRLFFGGFFFKKIP